jgi:hypothetical protein
VWAIATPSAHESRDEILSSPIILAIPTLATMGVAGSQRATLQIAELIEQKQRMVGPLFLCDLNHSSR